MKLDLERLREMLSWEERPAADALQLDYHRVTEDGAEAVALALVHASHSWVVLRRLQREEHADWLFRDTTSRRLVALEVRGPMKAMETPGSRQSSRRWRGRPRPASAPHAW